MVDDAAWDRMLETLRPKGCPDSEGCDPRTRFDASNDIWCCGIVREPEVHNDNVNAVRVCFLLGGSSLEEEVMAMALEVSELEAHGLGTMLLGASLTLREGEALREEEE